MSTIIDDIKGTIAQLAAPGEHATHAVCPPKAACPNCGEKHAATEPCYGGFDPDVDELRWDGQP